MSYRIEVTDPDRRIDYCLTVTPYCDDAGRYVEPNELILDSMTVWHGKLPATYKPATNLEAKRLGYAVAKKLEPEIDEAVRREIAKSKEPQEAA